LFSSLAVLFICPRRRHLFPLSLCRTARSDSPFSSVSLRSSALIPLLRPARSDAARIHTRLASCLPREGLTKP
ncbi:hypothetical protein ACQKWADRAFT_289182, partial [Trichoderma austrokoningii]